MTRRGMPPVTGMVKTSVLPSYSPAKARVWPSGEKMGAVSMPTPVVRRSARPPSREDGPDVAGVAEGDEGLGERGALEDVLGLGDCGSCDESD